MWIYSQSTGNLTRDDALIGTGYSGTGAGRNNPAEQATRNVGPIPQGLYQIGPAYTVAHLGPLAMPLTPIGHNALGRTGFFCHGDSINHAASHGCIILGPAVRQQLADTEDRELMVTA